METRSDARYFRTTSLTLAIFLCVKDQQIVSINRVPDSTKKEFVFVLTPHLEKLVETYKFGERSSEELKVSVHMYEQSRNDLLDLLNGN